MVDSAPNRSRSGFRALTGIFILLGLTLLIYGLFHKSDQPELLSRYSTSYAVLLACIAVVVLALCWLLWRQPPRTMRWAGNAYVFFISAIIALVGTEIGLRVFNPWGIDYFHVLPYHMQGMVDHPQLGYVHPKSVSYELGANTVILNTHGLRDEEIPYAKPPDENRVLVLGDSVTFGWGVTQGESFADRMEPLLRARTGKKWQAINAGVNGYNSEQEATFFRIDGLRYAPDIVVLVYVYNDVDPVIEPNLTTWRRYPTWPSGLPQLLERARSLSYLYQSTNLFARMGLIGAGQNPSGDKATPGVSSITSHPRWAASRAALEEIANQCKNLNIRFLIARESGDDPAFFAELEKLGIEAIALGPAWKDVPADQHRVSRIDAHPSAAVHDRFAVHLVDALDTRGWLEP